MKNILKLKTFAPRVLNIDWFIEMTEGEIKRRVEYFYSLPVGLPNIDVAAFTRHKK
jgi:hypothetical protein